MINGIEKHVHRMIQEDPKHSLELGNLDAKMSECFRSADLSGKSASLITEKAKSEKQLADLKATFAKECLITSTMLAEVEKQRSPEEFANFQAQIAQVKLEAGLE